MSGLEPLALAALVGSTAAQAGSQLMAAGERSAAAEFEQQQYKQQAEAARTAAMQDETARRRELTSNLEAIAAIRSGRGVGGASPTGMAIFENATDLTSEEIGASRANYAAKADLASRAAKLSERKASTSMLAGYLGAASTVGSAAFRASTPYTPRS